MGGDPLSSCPNLAYSCSWIIGGVVNVRPRSRSGRAFRYGLLGVKRCTVDRRIDSSKEPYTHYIEPLDTCYPGQPVLQTPHPLPCVETRHPLRAFRRVLLSPVGSYGVCTDIDSPWEPYTDWTRPLDRYALHRPVRGSPYPQVSSRVRFPFFYPLQQLTGLYGQISGRYTKQSFEGVSQSPLVGFGLPYGIHRFQPVLGIGESFDKISRSNDTDDYSVSCQGKSFDVVGSHDLRRHSSIDPFFRGYQRSRCLSTYCLVKI